MCLAPEAPRRGSRRLRQRRRRRRYVRAILFARTSAFGLGEFRQLSCLNHVGLPSAHKELVSPVVPLIIELLEQALSTSPLVLRVPE